MPYIDPTGTDPGWSDSPQPGLGLTTFVDEPPSPPAVIPQTVTRYQARAALLEAGTLDQVNTYFTSLPDTSMDKLAWNEAPTVTRSSAALTAAAHALGLADAQIDALFVRAAQFL